jgi:hypothetical protein
MDVIIYDLEAEIEGAKSISKYVMDQMKDKFVIFCSKYPISYIKGIIDAIGLTMLCLWGTVETKHK